MASSTSVLDIIAAADLSPTEHLLLKHFVETAVDSELAAQYISARIDAGGDRETSLRSFKKHWRRLVFLLSTIDPVPRHLEALLCRRDGASCTISGAERSDVSTITVESAYIIPPSMIEVIEDPSHDILAEILGAFLSPPYVARLKTLLSHRDSDEVALQNLWRLSPSVHQAFRRGHLDIRSMAQVRAELGYPTSRQTDGPTTQYSVRKLYPEEPQNLFFGDGTEFDRGTLHFKVSTPEAALSLPSSFLFEVHFRFATALHLFFIEDKISLGWPKPERITLFPPLVRRVFYWISPCISLSIRMRFYSLLRPVGRWMYGPASVGWIQRLPFGLVMKEGINAPKNEPHALRLVEQYTTVSAPRVVDVGAYNDKTFLMMTYLPGQQLGDVAHLMSYAERDRLADALAACVTQLQRIPNNTAYMFGDTLGEPMIDHRLPDGRGGPFNTEADFNNHLASHLACTITEALDGQIIRQDHLSHFTHSDFHATNILLEDGRLSGIVDWECAGYKPEYWEFTKAVYASKWEPIQEAVFYRTFGREYEAELEVERKPWKLTPFGV